MKLRRAVMLATASDSSPYGCTIGHWLSGDYRWAFINGSAFGMKVGWRVLAHSGPSSIAHNLHADRELLRSVGLDQALFKTRREMITALKLVLQAAS